jgi:hypothetical protein
VPTKSPQTERWHLNVRGKDFELLINDVRFYDTRAKKGGGGAIDLVMQLFGLDFVGAMAEIKRLGI